MKSIKGFNVLIMGAFFAKVFGFLREALFFVFLGYNNDFSQILSLLAFTSVAIVFADTSLLNINSLFNCLFTRLNQLKLIGLTSLKLT